MRTIVVQQQFTTKEESKKQKRTKSKKVKKVIHGMVKAPKMHLATSRLWINGRIEVTLVTHALNYSFSFWAKKFDKSAFAVHLDFIARDP